jgi:hypothetical protein
VFKAYFIISAFAFNYIVRCSSGVQLKIECFLSRFALPKEKTDKTATFSIELVAVPSIIIILRNELRLYPRIIAQSFNPFKDSP